MYVYTLYIHTLLYIKNKHKRNNVFTINIFLIGIDNLSNKIMHGGARAVCIVYRRHRKTIEPIIIIVFIIIIISYYVYTKGTSSSTTPDKRVLVRYAYTKRLIFVCTPLKSFIFV